MATEPVAGTSLEDALAQAELLAGDVMDRFGLPRALGWFVRDAAGKWAQLPDRPDHATAQTRGWTGIANHPAAQRHDHGPEVDAALRALVGAAAVRRAVAGGKAELAAWHAVTLGKLAERLLAATIRRDES